METREQKFKKLVDLGVLFGRKEDAFIRGSRPLMNAYGISNADVTDLLDTSMWIPSDQVPSWSTWPD